MFYLSYAGYEMKKWMRDSMTKFMVFYPLLIGLIGRYLFPLASNQSGFDLSPYYHIVLAALSLIVPRISGAVAAFSILDDRDDNILYSVKVAPLSLEFFIGLKLLMVFLLGFFGVAFVLWFSNLVDLSLGAIFTISFVAAFGGPMTALLINSFASNKVEGFAAIKSLNALIIFPIASLFFFDGKEFIFAFEPGFWPAKALSTLILKDRVFQLNFGAYYWVGLLYAAGATVLAYRAFRSKVQ